MSERGVSIALIGIDGAGKTTLARALTAALAERGVEVVDVTWVGAVGSLPAGYPRTSIEQLGVEGWRLFYAGRTIEGRPVDELVPSLFADFGASELPLRIEAASGAARQSGVVTSALVELAGNYLLHMAVAGPVLRRGGVALNDGFGLKNVLKAIRLAARMAPDEVPPDALDALAQHAIAVFSDAFLQPDIGFLLDADPRLSHDWRVAQNGRLGAGEDLDFAGRPGRETYLEFQSSLAAEYREVSRRWGWHALSVDGRPAAETAAEAVGLVLDHPGITALIAAAADSLHSGRSN